MDEIAFKLNDFTVNVKNIEIDHYAFEDCGLVTADVEVNGVSVGYSACVVDGEIDVYRYSCWESCTDLMDLLDALGVKEDGGDTERYEKLFAAVLEPVVVEGALTEAGVGRLLEREGLCLLGRDPARDLYWRVGKVVSDDGLTCKTIGYYPSLLAIFNSLDELVAEHTEFV